MNTKYGMYSNEELVNFCFAQGNLTPLEIELLHRLEDLMGVAAESCAPPDPGWVQAMFPECYDTGR